MSKRRTKAWLELQKAPDRQIRHAADQYDAARQLLAAAPDVSSVLLPLMNASIVALELYLKSLSSARVHQFWSIIPAIWTVHSEPKIRSHTLVDLYDAISDDSRVELDQQFKQKFSGSDEGLRHALEGYEGLFAVSRYPFEIGSDIGKYPVEPLLSLVTLLSTFVTSLPATNN